MSEKARMQSNVGKKEHVIQKNLFTHLLTKIYSYDLKRHGKVPLMWESSLSMEMFRKYGKVLGKFLEHKEKSHEHKKQKLHIF